MSLIYKDFDINDPATPKPWAPREVQAWKDLIDTVVMDAIVQTKQTGGHKHNKLYSPSAVAGVEVLEGGIVQMAVLDSEGIVLNDASGNLSTIDKLPIAKGGTNSDTALNNDRVMVSVGGAIVESAILTSELDLLNDMVGFATGAANNDKFATQGYVDDNVFPAIVPINRGGTNSDTALNNDRVMVSSAGKIVESAQVTVDELNLLNGLTAIVTGTGNNDKLVTQGYVDDIGLVAILPIARGGTNSDTALSNGLIMISESGKIVEGAVTVTEIGLLSGRTATDLSNWDTAFSWGDHAGLYEPAGTVATHESTYNHANYDTAYGWGDHAGLYEPLGTVSTHESTYNHGNYDTAYGWGDHAGLYEPLGTVSTHESTYNHTNYDTAYGWGDHAGLYEPVGSVSTHESTYNHANYDTAYSHSQIVGGDSVHVSVTENSNWDTAYSHSQVTGSNPHTTAFLDLTDTPSGYAWYHILYTSNVAVVDANDFLWNPTAKSLALGLPNPDTALSIHAAKTATNAQIGLTSFSATDSHKALLLLQKSATNTLGSYSTTVSGESLGEIQIMGVSTANNPAVAAKIWAYQVDTAGAVLVPGRLYLEAASQTAVNAKQLVLDGPTGGVGIFTDAPMRDIAGTSGDLTTHDGFHIKARSNKAAALVLEGDYPANGGRGADIYFTNDDGVGVGRSRIANNGGVFVFDQVDANLAPVSGNKNVLVVDTANNSVGILNGATFDPDTCGIGGDLSVQGDISIGRHALKGDTVDLADDAYTSFTPENPDGTIIITCMKSGLSAIIAYALDGTTPYCRLVAQDSANKFEVNTITITAIGDVNDTYFTVSYDTNGDLYFANRLGST